MRKAERSVTMQGHVQPCLQFIGKVTMHTTVKWHIETESVCVCKLHQVFDSLCPDSSLVTRVTGSRDSIVVPCVVPVASVRGVSHANFDWLTMKTDRQMVISFCTWILHVFWEEFHDQAYQGKVISFLVNFLRGTCKRSDCNWCKCGNFGSTCVKF